MAHRSKRQHGICGDRRTTGDTWKGWMSKHALTTDTAFPKRRELRKFAPVEEAPLPPVDAPPPLPVHPAATAEADAGTFTAADVAAMPETATMPEAATDPDVGTDHEVSTEPENLPEPEQAPEPTLRELFPPMLDLPPLAGSHTPTPNASAAAAAPTPPPSRTRKRFLAATVGLAASGALAFTMTLPGIELGSTDAASAATLPQQALATGGTGDLAQAFDALNSVQVEAGDSGGSFINYMDSPVQYPFATPVALTDPFGERLYPVAGMHDAQDFAAAEGTPIQAIADGRVIEAGYANDGCGWGLKLQHTIDGNDVTSRYCHMQMNSHAYEVGEEVKVGDPAGRVGTTGMAFGAHLHFALTVNGEAIDPMPFLLKYNRLLREK